jgi:Dolichyl-phosphate-mannose-protein mannosyltransferase
VALVVFGLVVLQPVLHAELVLVDDHEILELTLPSAGPSFTQLLPIVVASDPAAGRLRPMYWVVRLGQITLFKDSAAAWHASVLGLGLISAGLLYATWRSLGAGPLPALLLGAWLLVAPGVSSNWVRLGTNETTATPFFVLAMWAAAQAATRRRTRGWDVVFVVASLGAILSKESFSLAAPALAGVRVLASFDGRQCARTGWPASAVLVAAVGVVFAGLQFAVGAQAGSQSYGGAFLNAPSIGTYAVNIAHNLLIIGFASSGWLVLLVLWPGRVRWLSGERRPAVLATAVALLLLVPQLLLYSRQGVLEGKYELPAAIAVAGWIIAGLVWLRDRAPRVYALGLACWAIALVGYAFSTWSYASFFTEDSLQLQRLVSRVASNMPRGAVVGIAGDPAGDYEPMLSFVDQLAHAGRDDVQLKALPLPIDAPYTPAQATLARSLLATGLGQPGPLSPSDCTHLDGVIVLHDAEVAVRALPCLANFERLDFSRQVLLWGGDQVSLRPRLPGLARPGYVLLVPVGR